MGIVTQAFAPLLFLEMGVAILAGGLYQRTRGQYKTPDPASRAHWRKQLWTWRVVDYDGATRAVAEDIRCTSSAINAFAIICAGVTMVVTTLIYTAIVTVLTGDPSFAPTPETSYVAYFSLSLCGYGIGYILGVRRLHAGQRVGVAYGDLRRRRLDDYRSSLLLLLPVLLLAATAWATLSLLPTFGGQLYIEPVGYERIRIPYQPLLLALLPSAMVVVAAVAEVIMRRIVALPRLLVTADPAAALHADEMIRALAITVVQSGTLETLAFLGYAQWSLLSDNLFAHHSYGAAHGIVGSYPFLALVVFLLGVLLTNCRGRIGGRITGWPRQGTRVTL